MTTKKDELIAMLTRLFPTGDARNILWITEVVAFQRRIATEHDDVDRLEIEVALLERRLSEKRDELVHRRARLAVDQESFAAVIDAARLAAVGAGLRDAIEFQRKESNHDAN